MNEQDQQQKDKNSYDFLCDIIQPNNLDSNLKEAVLQDIQKIIEFSKCESLLDAYSSMQKETEEKLVILGDDLNQYYELLNNNNILENQEKILENQKKTSLYDKMFNEYWQYASEIHQDLYPKENNIEDFYEEEQTVDPQVNEIQNNIENSYEGEQTVATQVNEIQNNQHIQSGNDNKLIIDNEAQGNQQNDMTLQKLNTIEQFLNIYLNVVNIENLHERKNNFYNKLQSTFGNSITQDETNNLYDSINKKINTLGEEPSADDIMKHSGFIASIISFIENVIEHTLGKKLDFNLKYDTDQKTVKSFVAKYQESKQATTTTTQI